MVTTQIVNCSNCRKPLHVYYYFDGAVLAESCGCAPKMSIGKLIGTILSLTIFCGLAIMLVLAIADHEPPASRPTKLPQREIVIRQSEHMNSLELSAFLSAPKMRGVKP